MLDTGIPVTFISWVQSFFNDRRARVQLFNVCSSSRCFTQGLLQGTVLTPSVFLFCINNLASSCNSDAVIALFADDVSNLTTIRKKEDAEAAVQSLVNSALIWNQEWKLNLNADKSEVCPFSIWSNGSTWQPAFFVGTQKIWVNITLCLLGYHPVFILVEPHSTHFLGLVLFHSEDGFSHTNSQQARYASPTWQPWLSATNLSCWDHLQNFSLWLVTGQLLSSPLEAIRLKADVQNNCTCSNPLILKAREKALRSTDDHAKCDALAADILQHLLNRCSICSKTNNLSTILPPELQHRQSNYFPSPPWQLSTPCKERIATTVPGITGRVMTLI